MPIWNFIEISNDIKKLIILTLFATISAVNAKPFAYFLAFSCRVGEKLVDLFLSVFNLVAGLFYSFLLACQVIYEDATLFLVDAKEKLIFAGSLLQDFYSSLWTLSNVLCLLGQKCTHLVLQVVYFFTYLVISTSEIVLVLKECLLITGLYIWTSFLSIPSFIGYSISSFKNEFITLSFQFIDYVLKCLEIIINFQYEAICGLLIGACLVTAVYVKFKELCAVLCYISLKLYQFARSQLISILSHAIFTFKRKKSVPETEPVEDERLCVICQIQPREIIIFPCKHLCLCTDCSTALSIRQLNCPLCRSHIGKTLRVYW